MYLGHTEHAERTHVFERNNKYIEIHHIKIGFLFTDKE